MIPFFFNLIFFDQQDPDNQALNLSMVSAVVANVSGLLTGGLHLFLRSNILSTIGPKSKYEAERQKFKRGIRVWAPGSNVDYSGHIMAPVSAPRPLQRADSAATLIDKRSEKEEEEAIESPKSLTYDVPRVNPLRSNAVYPMAPAMPIVAQSTSLQPPQNAKTHARKGSYSLFPAGNDTSNTKSVTLLPATTYSPSNLRADDNEALKPPPSIHTNGRHRRDSSMASSATVQIGLRLSNVDDMPPLNSRYFQDQNKVYTLDCPNNKDEQKRPSPLSQLAMSSSENLVPDETSTRDPVKDARMKTLPPVPKVIEKPQQSPDDTLILSPTVYSPESSTATKAASPKSAGLSIPASKSSPGASGPRSPPRPQPSRDMKKADWI
jgi:hypothetical protein